MKGFILIGDIGGMEKEFDRILTGLSNMNLDLELVRYDDIFFMS